VQYALRVNAERLGLSAHTTFPFWENAGETNDVMGGIATATNPLWVTGGADFLTNDGMINVENHSCVPLIINGTVPWAIQCHFLQDITSDYRTILYFESLNYDFFHVRMVYGDFYVTSHNGSIYQCRADTNLSNNIFVKAILSYDGNGKLTLFKDGKVFPWAIENLTSSTHFPDFSPGVFRAKLCSSNIGSGQLLFVDILNIYNSEINEQQAAQLNETPYALLMPVSRPVYFDLATGNTNSSADPGNIAISGSAATGVKASTSSANSGTVAIAGSVASGIRSLVSLATAASIAIAGFSAEGVYTPTGSAVSSAGAGVVAIAGAPATGIQTHISSADPGAIAIVGNTANAATGYASIAEPGTVAIIGTDATASRTYVATASPTAIAITGSPAYATKSGGSSTSSGISLIFGKVILHL
jgi:hypothetical protein